MNEIRQWALSLCAAVLLGQLLCMLLPRLKQHDPFKTTLNLFIVCALISPMGGGFDLELDSGRGTFSSGVAENRLEEETDRQFYDLVSRKISDSIEIKLAGIRVNVKKINVIMDTKDKNSISISKIEIVLESGTEGREAEVTAEVEKVTGVTPEIRYMGE